MQIIDELIAGITVDETNLFPFSKLLLLPVILFTIGILGVLFNKKNLVFLLLSLELMLLAATLNFIFFSVFLNDAAGQVFALAVLTVAAAESAIGLGILVIIFRLKQTIDFSSLNYLRG